MYCPVFDSVAETSSLSLDLLMVLNCWLLAFYICLRVVLDGHQRINIAAKKPS
jgi:hypothetical protein